jgi:hypothetical protein
MQSLQPLASPSIPCRRSPLAAAVGHIAPTVWELLTAFPKIVSDGNARPQPHHGVEHVAETTGQMPHAKARRLDPEKLGAAETEFRALDAAGSVANFWQIILAKSLKNSAAGENVRPHTLIFLRGSFSSTSAAS